MNVWAKPKSSPQDQPACDEAADVRCGSVDDAPAGDPPAAAPAQTPSQAPDYIAELQQLAGLHDQGIITNEEFEAKKRQLLGL